MIAGTASIPAETLRFAGQPHSAVRRRVLWAWLFCWAPVALTGCLPEELDTRYGHRSAIEGGQSINGTSVLSDLFSRSKRPVQTEGYLSDRVAAETDVLVWFTLDGKPPSDDAVEWLEDWLDTGAKPRTLILVGRDFDCEPAYWESVLSLAPADKQTQVQANLDSAKINLQAERDDIPASEPEDHHWFQLSKGKPRKPTTFWGEAKWLEGLDTAKLDIELSSRLQLPDRGEVDTLLASESDIIAARLRNPEQRGQVIVIANGSFLLNARLVNHEHRKLAARLVEETPVNAKVTFLEASSDVSVVEDDPPPPKDPGALSLFTAPTLGLILLHLAVIGIVYCFWRLPLFGIPRRADEGHQSDFGEHLTALGALLAKTGDLNYAQTRVQLFHQHAGQRDVTANASSRAGKSEFKS